MSDETLFQFGYISRAHGLNGEVVIRTFDPASTVVNEVEKVVARLRDGTERELTFREVRDGPAGDLLASFKGINRRLDADVLRGCGLFVKRDELEPPAEGEFFQGDLVGLEAVTPEGVSLGVVDSFFSAGPVPNLVIMQGDEELMVPFAEDFVKEISLEKRRIVIEKPAFEEP